MWDFHRSQETPATKAMVTSNSRNVTREVEEEEEELEEVEGVLGGMGVKPLPLHCWWQESLVHSAVGSFVAAGEKV